MKRTLLNIATLTALTISLAGCGGGGGGSTPASSSSTVTLKTISGTAVDGYISGATVCLDINSNDSCDNNEPKAITNSNGVYTFDTNTTGTYPIIVTGGVDTTTNKSFNGILKDTIIITNDDETVTSTITPLTTIAHEIYQDKKISNPNYTPTDAKNTLAQKLGFDSVSMISKDPMTDKDVFNKTQQIIQTIELITLNLTDSNQTQDKQKAFLYLIDSISTTINQSSELNISKAVNDISTKSFEGKAIVIDTNTKTYVNDFVKEIDSQMKSSTTTIASLSTIQNNLQSFTDDAKEKIVQNNTSSLVTIVNQLKSTTITTDNTPVCTQVITYAKNPTTKECQSFGTPCDVPTGWTSCVPVTISPIDSLRPPQIPIL